MTNGTPESQRIADALEAAFTVLKEGDVEFQSYLDAIRDQSVHIAGQTGQVLDRHPTEEERKLAAAVLEVGESLLSMVNRALAASEVEKGREAVVGQLGQLAQTLGSDAVAVVNAAVGTPDLEPGTPPRELRVVANADGEYRARLDVANRGPRGSWKVRLQASDLMAPDGRSVSGAVEIEAADDEVIVTGARTAVWLKVDERQLFEPGTYTGIVRLVHVDWDATGDSDAVPVPDDAFIVLRVIKRPEQRGEQAAAGGSTKP